MNKTPDILLKDLGEVFQHKNAQYKDNYKTSFPAVMKAFFPDGMELVTESDFARFGVFTNIVYKLTRYTPRWYEGGHPDSMTDMPVYACMLQELDNEFRDSKGKVEKVDAIKAAFEEMDRHVMPTLRPGLLMNNAG